MKPMIPLNNLAYDKLRDLREDYEILLSKQNVEAINYIIGLFTYDSQRPRLSQSVDLFTCDFQRSRLLHPVGLITYDFQRPR